MLRNATPSAILGRPAMAALLAAAALAVGAATSPAALASAAITLGQTAPPDIGGCGDCDVFALKTDPASPSYRVPKGRWTVTKWSAQGGGTEDGEARLRIYRPSATQGRFKLIRQSDFEEVPADERPKHDTKLNVEHGDRLGLFTAEGVASGFSAPALPGDIAGEVGCDPTGPGFAVGTGTSCPVSEATTTRVNAWAKLRKR